MGIGQGRSSYAPESKVQSCFKHVSVVHHLAKTTAIPIRSLEMVRDKDRYDVLIEAAQTIRLDSCGIPFP